MFTANIYTLLDRGMVLIQLCAGSFHTKTVQNCMQSSKVFEEFKSEDKDKDLVIEDNDKDLQISPRGSLRTSTFLEDNNTDVKPTFSTGHTKALMPSVERGKHINSMKLCLPSKVNAHLPPMLTTISAG